MICKACGIDKPASEYRSRRYRAGGPIVLRGTCRACERLQYKPLCAGVQKFDDATLRHREQAMNQQAARIHRESCGEYGWPEGATP